MRWSDRQLAILQALGLRVWQPQDPVQSERPPAAPTVTPEALDTPVTRAEPAAKAATAAPDDLSTASAAGETIAGVRVIASRESASVIEPVSGTDVAAMDWPTLRANVAACTACALCKSRTQTVFGVGHEHAHWMIVGEAPGEQEDLRGEPFVGAAGRLLDRMLLALGLSRDAADAQQQVYIANTLKCRPPNNRNPQPGELARCLPYLERQVQLVQPRVILAMGRFAVQALLASSEPIGRLRNKVHDWRGWPLVVTYHPAYLLRQPGEKSKAWADLCLAADVIERKPDA